MLPVLSVQQCMNVHVYPLTPSDPARGAWQSPVNTTWIQSAAIQDGFNLLTHNLFHQHTLVCVRPSAGSCNEEPWLMGNSFASCFCFISNRAEVTTAGETIYYLNCLAKVPSEQHSIRSIFNVGGIIKCLKQCMLGIGGRFYLLCGLKVLRSRCTHMEVFTNVQK